MPLVAFLVGRVRTDRLGNLDLAIRTLGLGLGRRRLLLSLCVLLGLLVLLASSLLLGSSLKVLRRRSRLGCVVVDSGAGSNEGNTSNGVNSSLVLRGPSCDAIPD